MINGGSVPAVFAKFVRREIDGEQGRVLYSILNAFCMAGLGVALFDNFRDRALGKYAEAACRLPGVSLTSHIPAHVPQCVYLYDEENWTLGALPWGKKIRVSYDIFSTYWLTSPVLMPYPLHPVHSGPGLQARISACRARRKKVRILFSGQFEGYDKVHVHYPKAKLPRRAVISAVMSGMGDRLTILADQASVNAFFADRSYVEAFALVDARTTWIDDRIWLDTLAQADFFLCPPGIVMPMCHNAIEAMAVGAIPIISYPEWFNPPLRNMVNCVVYDDEKDLLEKVNETLAMNPRRVRDLREQVIAYYDTHLRPDYFVRAIMNSRRRRTTLLVITEAAVARNASRLGPHSILLRGTAL